MVVHFSDQSFGAGPGAAYQWDLGNGNSAAVADPVATYTQPGSYTVTLTVKYGGQSSGFSQTITVYTAPTAAFTVSATRVCAPTPILFTSTSTSAAGGGAIAGYLALWFVHWVFKLVRGVEGMGYGDFKLLGALGAWLGWAALPQIIMIAAVAGAIVGLVATWRGRMRFEEPLPFGPFLAAGGAITLFSGTPFYFAFGG